MHWLAIASACVLWAGCVTTESTPTYVVHFTLTNTGDEMLGFEYPHCGKARLREHHVEVDAPRPSGDALVVVEPDLAQGGGASPGFATSGVEADVFGIGPDEVRVPDGVTGSDAAIVVLALQDGKLLVDGIHRALPYAGTSQHPEGRWSATYTIAEGPEVVKIDHRERSCE